MIDVLNKYSHDSDNDVAYNAIFAMGLVGAGTNNARYVPFLFSYFYFIYDLCFPMVNNMTHIVALSKMFPTEALLKHNKE